ncbi:MAG TPA: hypothetical protein GXX25_05745 [Desulfotomaculum sp.]|uniref:hypothetical protein n=1 Tax=Desulfofundulus thermobenzoicus TaxID=29376 RepID=UPI00128FB19C|nr:hypothetical protein [Desulfofundulus thermobenzoicus]HHW43303.1 hypothetical protein [Desulfotomaculum sp.]
MGDVLLAAIDRNLLLEALRRAAEHPFVVFGTMDGQTLAALQAGAKVYFYECD